MRGTRVLCFFRLALSRDFCFIRASFLGFPLPLYGCPCRFLAPLLPGLSFLAVLSSSCHRCSGLVISNSYRRRHRMLLAIREENQKAAMQRQEKVRGTLWCMKVSEHSQLRQRPGAQVDDEDPSCLRPRPKCEVSPCWGCSWHQPRPTSCSHAILSTADSTSGRQAHNRKPNFVESECIQVLLFSSFSTSAVGTPRRKSLRPRPTASALGWESRWLPCLFSERLSSRLPEPARGQKRPATVHRRVALAQAEADGSSNTDLGPGDRSQRVS